MKIKLYFSQTLFTLEQQLLNFFSTQDQNEHAIFICPFAKRLDVAFLEQYQAVVIPYFATIECHEKLLASLLNLLGKHSLEGVDIHFPVTPYGVAMLALEAIRHLSCLNDKLRLHVWDSEIEGVFSREILIDPP